MLLKFFILCGYLVASDVVYSAVIEQDFNSCSPNEFNCGDGTCVGLNSICDGMSDCAHGEDEQGCESSLPSLLVHDPVIQRSKRQAAGCRRDQWQCRDGTCISFDGKCDGAYNCPDGSDETHALCRNVPCQSNWFRCTYGACVDGTAPCNGIQECVDNSDELLPQCRNETMETNGSFKCADGSTIISANLCDGTRDCPDGSDETVRACAGNTCWSHLFQCAYGACVDQGSDCNNIQECADGSDEADELCNRTTTGTPIISSPDGKCVLPPYPEHGSYVAIGIQNAAPGQRYNNLQINVTCQKGYGVMGDSSVLCSNGWWPQSIPECVRFCKLNKHPSVDYYCLVTGKVEGRRICEEYEPSNTVVLPECKKPNYYATSYLRNMRCIDGSWDYVATCEAECGRVTPAGVPFIIDGRKAERGELPWHAGIYSKQYSPYMQICGGTLVTNTVVISAAHCFWDNNTQLPAEMYAVALGKLYRPWNNQKDVDVQKSDVKQIKLPVKFRGSNANYQEDIALVTLKTFIEYQTYIRPACLSFDYEFEQRQLRNGNMGKVAGWGLTSVDGAPSQVLKVLEIPFVDTVECQERIPTEFIEYITSDKFCAGYGNGTALCQGDSGGGLVFPATETNGAVRYYLRGIVSTAPKNQEACNALTLTTFTEVQRHEYIIRQNTYA